MGNFAVDFNLAYILPEVFLIGAGFLLILLEAFLGRSGRSLLALVAVLGVLGAGFALTRTPVETEPVLGGMIRSDTFGMYFRAVLLAVLLMVYLVSVEYAGRKNMPAGEFYALLAFATSGAMLMTVAADLISFYLGLELLSISSYVLAGLLRDERSLEASLKYFVIGAMASGILLFGFSLLFGATGTTALADIATAVTNQSGNALLTAAIIFILAGLGVKAAAAPFHLWAPDTYEGAPTPVSAFLSVASEGAAIAAMLRIFHGALHPLQSDWAQLLAVVAVISMTVGNVAALHQTNVKRMLAYSSITNIGYILAGLAVGSAAGFSAVMFYVLAYAFMNIGAFAVLMALANQGEAESLDGLRGLARREPVLAFLMLLFMLSLLGFPPLAGFFAKLFIFRAAVEGGMAWLAVVMAVNSAISVGYYYNVVKSMYVSAPGDEVRERGVVAGIVMQVGLALAAAGVVVIGLMPGAFMAWTQAAALVR